MRPPLLTQIASLLLLFAQSGLAEKKADSRTIPLESHRITTSEGQPIYKLGIRLSLGGGSPKLYEFDTGASGLYAAYSPAWWPNYRSFNSSFTQKYSSGIEYQGIIVTTEIDFGHGIPPVTTNVGLIQTASGGPIINWSGHVARDRPPLFGHFYGDFGAGLGPGKGMFALLPQLPGNYSSGMIVSTGGNRAPSPFLTVGLTENFRSQFRSLTPMKARGNAGSFPSPSGDGGGWQLYDQKLIDANLSLTKDGAIFSVPTAVVLDSGAPSAFIHDIDRLFGVPKKLVTNSGTLLPGTQLNLSAPPRGEVFPWNLSFQTGTQTGYSLVNYSTEANLSNTEPYVNSGLNAFFRYDVMFDLERGVVGFRRIVGGRPILHLFGASERRTSKAEITLRGSARGGKHLIQFLEISVGNKVRRTAAGRNWEVRLPLHRGENSIVLRAVDLAGTRSKPQRVLIERL